MTFSNYHIYVEIVAARDHVIFILTMFVLLVFVVLGYVALLRPKWLRPAAWLLGFGGFYATLAAWSLYLLSRSAGH